MNRFEDWNKLLEISDDRNSLKSTRDEWNDSLHKFEDKLRRDNII